MMPSTSDQIHNSSASRTDARIDAEKSDPPRPSVVGRPSSVAPLKPVTIGIAPDSMIGSKRLSRLLPRLIQQRFRVPELVIGNDQFGSIHGFGTNARTIQIGRDHHGRQSLTGRNGFVHRARRPLAQHQHAVSDPLKLTDQDADFTDRSRTR